MERQEGSRKAEKDPGVRLCGEMSHDLNGRRAERPFKLRPPGRLRVYQKQAGK